MPFGLYNGSGTFQHLMETILGYQRFQLLLLYLDGVVVFSSSFENLSCLRLAFSCFQECDLKVKCSAVFLNSGPAWVLARRDTVIAGN